MCRLSWQSICCRLDLFKNNGFLTTVNINDYNIYKHYDNHKSDNNNYDINNIDCNINSNDDIIVNNADNINGNDNFNNNDDNFNDNGNKINDNYANFNNIDDILIELNNFRHNNDVCFRMSKIVM